MKEPSIEPCMSWLWRQPPSAQMRDRSSWLTADPKEPLGKVASITCSGQAGSDSALALATGTFLPESLF